MQRLTPKHLHLLLNSSICRCGPYDIEDRKRSGSAAVAKHPKPCRGRARQQRGTSNEDIYRQGDYLFS